MAQPANGSPVNTPDGRDFALWLDEMAAKLEDGTQRRMVQVLREHWYYEVVEFDLEKVMATLVPDPHYLLYGPLQRLELRGQEAVRELYTAQFGGGAGSVTIEVDHFALGARVIALEGRAAMRLDSGAGRALAGAIDGIDLDRPGLIRLPTAVFIPFDGDLMAGEINYFDAPPGLHHVAYLDE